jgi:hypothetical protein
MEDTSFDAFEAFVEPTGVVSIARRIMRKRVLREKRERKKSKEDNYRRAELYRKR